MKDDTCFCPTCGGPVEFSADLDRLCGLCGWWGDASELKAKPPSVDDLVLAFRQLLALYRDIHKKALLVEAGTWQSNDPEDQKTLRIAQSALHDCGEDIVRFFARTRAK